MPGRSLTLRAFGLADPTRAPAPPGLREIVAQAVPQRSFMPFGPLGPVEVAGTRIGLLRPVVLLAIPVLVAVFAYFLLRDRGPATSTRGERWAVFGSRLVLAVCLVVAAAGPFTLATVVSAGDPSVTMLEDRSASTEVRPAVADELAAAIEAEGVTVNRRIVADGNQSRIGDGVVGNLDENGSVLLLSDGHVTGGPSLLDAGTLANQHNVTVNAVSVDPNATERSVHVAGPASTSVDVQNQYTVTVEGVKAGPDPPPTRLEVRVDGDLAVERTIHNTSAEVVVRGNFSSVGRHRITARIDGGDVHGVNDVYRKTVRVISQPEVLYVSRGDYRLESYLERFYEVSTASTVPSDLDEYYTVVLQNMPAQVMGNASALQNFVLEGGGLVVAGGDSSYEDGFYRGTRLEAMTPVRVGESSGPKQRIVLALDISDSGFKAQKTVKALGVSALREFDGDSSVGLLAFDDRVHRIADIQQLGPARDSLETKIKRLENGFATRIDKALLGARDLLAERRGTVVLISDGIDDTDRAVDAAKQLEQAGGRVVVVGVGENQNAELLRGVAEATGGAYLTADRWHQLAPVVGNQQSGEGETPAEAVPPLSIVDRGHFITRDVETTDGLPHSNEVKVKAGASFLVANGNGEPAVAAWRYGVGRVVSISAYAENGDLGGLLSRPDSLLLSRSVNWAIGDPERETDEYAVVEDTRVDQRTPVLFHGDERPSASALSFARTDEGRYEATLRPAERGYQTLLGDEFAVNYRGEYSRFGRARTLDTLVGMTGGQTFSPDQGPSIAEAVVDQTERLRDERTDWSWAFVLAGLLVYLGEVSTRRIRQIRGHGTIP